MSASLVGSEMCIRDSCLGQQELASAELASLLSPPLGSLSPSLLAALLLGCLLYTSDAADDM
eukprot:3450960-Alexandrium_andersonii.AAC.1